MKHLARLVVKGTLGYALLLLLLFPRPAAADLVVYQESNSFPGAENAPTKTALQKVAVRGRRLRLLDEQSGWVLIVRLDRGFLWEFDACGKRYVERPLSYYERYRKERGQQRDALRSRYQACEDERTRAQVKKILDEEGIDPNGRDGVRVEEGKTETRRLLVDGLATDVVAKNFRIRENDARRAIIDLWVTGDIASEEDLLQFYQEVGTFPDEVAAALRKIEGFPLEVHAMVDSGEFKKVIHSVVREVRTEPAYDWYFELPEGFSKVESFEEQGGGELIDLKPPEILQCEFCGRPISDAYAKRYCFNDMWGQPGKRHLTCGTECKVKLIKRLTDEYKEKKRGSGR
jgi:hypothetical protein